jgi:tetratricopeptide (TPR) repeat protein
MSDEARLAQLERRVKIDPTSVVFAALAEEYRRLGRYDEAVAVCRAGLERHPAYLSARVTLGRALIDAGAFDEARAELERVLDAAPENLAALRALSEIHHRKGEAPETGSPRSPVGVAIPRPPETADSNVLSFADFADELRASERMPAAAPSPEEAVEQAVIAELERFLHQILAAKSSGVPPVA